MRMAADTLSRLASDLYRELLALEQADADIRAFHAPSECRDLVDRHSARTVQAICARHGFRNINAALAAIEARTSTRWMYYFGWGGLVR